MDEADSVENGPVNGEKAGDTKGHMKSELPRPDEEDAIKIDHSELPGENGTPGTSTSKTAVEVQESEPGHERDRALRKGSANSHRSRHSSSSSSSRKRSRSRHRHKSKHDDETRQRRSTSETRSNSATSHHSRTKHQDTTMDVAQDNTTTTDDDGPAYSVVHIDSFTTEDDDERPASTSNEEDTGREDKMVARMGKKLLTEKQKYVTEKLRLKERMEKARKQFEQEITRYKKEVDTKRQEIQVQFSDLQLDEQYSALNQRMEQLAGFREELDSRFLQSVEYEEEIEEIERYLDRRQQLCNSKEEDLRLLDDQLDTLHQELELDKERLERAGFDVKSMAPRNRLSSFRSPRKPTERDADDYILKANLRKCQSDLKRVDEMRHERDVELGQAREEISSLQSEKKKHREKIKQLETQLSIALSQLKNQTNSTHSSSAVNRYASARSHIALDSFKSPADLSINQQAQLNRSLSGKEKGSLSPVGKKYLRSGSSTTDSSGTQSRSDREHSRGSSSDGTPSEGDTGLDFQCRPQSFTEGSHQTRTVSSACAVM